MNRPLVLVSPIDMMAVGAVAAIVGALAVQVAGNLLGLIPPPFIARITVVVFGLIGATSLKWPWPAFIPAAIIAGMLFVLAAVEWKTDGLVPALGIALVGAVLLVIPACIAPYRLFYKGASVV